MSVQKDRRKQGNLALDISARNHSIYVMQITSNPNVFDPKYYNVLTYDLVKQAKDIFKWIWLATKTQIIDKQSYQQRIKYHKNAKKLCISLLADIEMAHKLFHLKAKRIKYWTKWVIQIRDKIDNQIEKDEQKYSSIMN